MFIHSGRGGLIALITFVCLVAAEVYTRLHYHSNDYFQEHSWPKALACLAAAALVWWLSPHSEKHSADPRFEKTWLVSHSQELPIAESEPPFFKLTFFRKQDSLFFIPVRLWPWLLCVLGAVLYLIPSSMLP